MTRSNPLALTVAVLVGWSAPAFAQHYAFERSLDTSAATTLDVTTHRGRITITADAVNSIRVRGTVTVRAAIDAPLDAVARAQRLAANPPIEQVGDRVQLRPPSDDTDRRAVTVSYDVIVPASVRVIANSNSGAVTITGVRGQVTAHTQSSTLTMSRLAGPAEITTGSGGVNVDDVGGAVDITTSSSAINARRLKSDVRVKTGSGAVSVESTGPGDVDITTSSSAITVEGATHGLRVRSGSGHIKVAGRPGAGWSLANSSGGIDVGLGSGSAAAIDASTRSGSILLTNLQVSGTQARQNVHGTIGAGGPSLEISNSSGTIEIRGR